MRPILSSLVAVMCVASLSAGAQVPASREHRSAPVLSFPEPGLDDSAAYQGYKTRFYRDAAGNTVQVYIDGSSGRVVNLLADAVDESTGLSVHNPGNRPTVIQWGKADASVATDHRTRTFEYELLADSPEIQIGHFLLGSMRVERDFQYARRHLEPLEAPTFVAPEFERLIAALDQLPAADRDRYLALVNAKSTSELSARLRPTISSGSVRNTWFARIVQPSLDARDTLAMEVLADSRRVHGSVSRNTLTLTAQPGPTSGIAFRIRITTTEKALTPLTRKEIFAPRFLDFLANAERANPTATRTRWLERETRGVELLASHEKLMAGLPAYATYFGRDMLVSALMMRPIWRPEMSEFAIAAALRKLGPHGEVSHEEALGGQADREAAGDYARLVNAHQLDEAAAVLRNHRRVRENYHMVDNAYQLPVMEALWLGDASVPPARKRSFLLATVDGESNARRMLRELALVSRMTAPYVDDPVATNLVSFPKLDSTHWQSASWRDSNEGYGGGRFAMDVNAIWAPKSLEGIETILREMKRAGVSPDSLLRAMPEEFAKAPLARYAADPGALRRAVQVWQGAGAHFLVSLSPAQVQSDVRARIAALPEAERRYWTALLDSSRADRDPLTFLALALDTDGKPIAVANTDPSTRLFLLDNAPDSAHAGVLRDVRLFARDFPVGLFIDRVGPVVSNDAYASPTIWPQFERDQYHGPRVVWGREANLFLLGAMKQLASAKDPAYAGELRSAIDRIESAVEASGFHSELWSYELRGGRMEPLRYGTGSDVQLWSTTDLAVQYALSRLKQ